MTTYTAPDGAKIDLDPATVKLLEAFALTTERTTRDVAAQAVELLRPVLLSKTASNPKGKL